MSFQTVPKVLLSPASCLSSSCSSPTNQQQLRGPEFAINELRSRSSSEMNASAAASAAAIALALDLKPKTELQQQQPQTQLQSQQQQPPQKIKKLVRRNASDKLKLIQMGAEEEKNRAWEMIGKKCNAPGKRVARAFKSLRESYRRELAHVKLMGNGFKPKWSLYEAMDFLRDVIRERKMQSPVKSIVYEEIVMNDRKPFKGNFYKTVGN
ncbi:hypothetical protein GQX74_012781 [Glossina fuscipes]|nr:hypothetical protein GQX74_012781 [Glossina fuscipes]